MSKEPDEAPELSTALRAGDLERVQSLLAAGADVHYLRPYRYDALLDAVYSPSDGTRLLETLDLLMRHGAALSTVSEYGESALRVLSRLGRFDAVAYLLKAGADRGQLAWTPLHEAVALGSASDVEMAIGTSNLETCDFWSRTAWLIAMLAGDIAKAELLASAGADTKVVGRGGMPPLFFAIHGDHPEMVRWLLDHGASANQTNDSGGTPLMEAVESDSFECVKVLLAAGADVNAQWAGTVLVRASNVRIALRLIEAGADPADMNETVRRTLAHLPAGALGIPDELWSDEFASAYARSFGTRNPERMNVPFWEAMIRLGISAYFARIRFEKAGVSIKGPVWCATRFGQSFTILPDGRVLQVAGEHEDFYDPDFCIYNDVFVHSPDGSFAIYGYPEAVFPPTDFHSATLVGDGLYLIGCLGYPEQRQSGETPIFRLDLHTLRIDRVPTTGDRPGWIYRHRADLIGDSAIGIRGGILVTKAGGQENHEPNRDAFVLDLKALRWTREAAG